MSKYHCLTVERMPEGGFVVYPARTDYNRGEFLAPLFATSSIGDALAFVRDKLDPAASQAMKGQGLPTSAEVAATFPNGVKFKPVPGSTGDWAGA